MIQSNKNLTSNDKKDFDAHGFILKHNFFSKEEIDLLYDTAVNDKVIQQNTYGRADSEGNTTNLALWYSLDDSLYSLLARSKRIVSGVELLLNGQPAHYHTKLMQKEPKVGGAWEWHQDYGYWYNDGFLLPQMLSVMTAFTPCTKENGCLQVLKRSHHIGRINHGTTGGQKGADQERLDVALERFDHQYVEMQPGDTLFFHGNLLHRSDMNRSDNPRWSIISAYNRISNKPYKGDNTSSYQSIEVVPDTAILHSDTSGISEESDFNEV
jgi:ectoine hydroxylase-related dioxygenase (phytanoyl-CoA dioxygenase family)